MIDDVGGKHHVSIFTFSYDVADCKDVVPSCF